MTQLQRDQIRRQRGQEALGLKPGQWSYLVGIGNKLHWRYELSCNGFSDHMGNWDQRASDRNDKHIERLETSLAQYVAKLGLYLYLQTDPRGATIYLDTKPIEESRYNYSVCVY